MKTAFLSITIFASFIFMGCSNNSNLSDYKIDYKELEETYGKDKISHIPKNLDVPYAFLMFTADEYCYIKKTGFTITYTTTDYEIDSLVKHYNNTCLQMVSPSDSCLLVVHPILNENLDGIDYIYEVRDETDDCNSLTSKIQANCKETSIPVPNFWETEFNDINITNNDRLNDNFTIYVLDAEKGKFLNQKILSDGCGLPIDWKNGYSKGVAINPIDNVVIYWLEIW